MHAIASKLLKKLKADDKLERCGLVLKGNKIIECENQHNNPARGFYLSPEDLVKYEDEMTGTWHTHPGQTANLSQEDHVGFNQWPRLLHFIVGTDGVRCFKVDHTAVIEVT